MKITVEIAPEEAVEFMSAWQEKLMEQFKQGTKEIPSVTGWLKPAEMPMYEYPAPMPMYGYPIWQEGPFADFFKTKED